MVVSIAVVAYNEAAYLPDLLSDICRQDYPHDKLEILLIDSCSTDGTYQIMNRFTAENHGFLTCRLFTNEKKLIPSGHNIAIDRFTGDALIRIDAHARIPEDFISKNAQLLESGEVAVGGRRPCITDRHDFFGKLLLEAENSPVGSSVAPYRTSSKPMYVSSLFCGMYRREVFEKVGKFNEKLPRSEDNDMCYRIRRAGFRLCYSPGIVYYQYVRRTFSLMLKQKFLNGFWVAKTLKHSPYCFSVFHFVPFFFTLALLFSVFLMLFGFAIPLVLISVIYLLTLLIFLAGFGTNKSLTSFLLLPAVIFAVHLSYGLGTLLGFIAMPFG